MGIAKTVLKRAIFVLIAICIMVAGSVQAQNVEYVGSTLWNSCQKTMVVGDYAYSTFQNGLQITDISSPSNPVVVGRAHIRMVEYDGYYSVMDLAVYGDYVYWTTNYDLLIIDISDRSNPTIAGEFDIPGITYTIYVEGNYAYISGSGAEYNFWILDLTDPLDPEIAGGLHVPSVIYEIYVSGDYAYLACADNGLQIVNVSDPSNPVIASGYIVDSYLLAITISGNYAYLTGNNPSLLFIFDISDPHNPALIATNDPDRWYPFLFVSGSLAYSFAPQGVFKIEDYSDPDNPIIIGAFQQFNSFMHPNHIFVAGNNAFITDDYGGVHILDVSNPGQPGLLANTSSTRSVSESAIVGNYAFVVDEFRGLFVVDISDPENPVYIARYFIGDGFFGGFPDIAIQENYAYLTVWGEGDLHIVDISNPSDPVGISTLDLPGYGTGIFLSEHYAHIANHDSSLYVIDILDPYNPQLIGEYSTSSPLTDVYISEDYAYISGNWCGLEVLDVSDPTAPTKIGEYGDFYAREISVDGDLAYMAGGFMLNILDISIPQSPSLISSLSSDYGASSVFVANNLVYLGCGLPNSRYGGLLIINAFMPSNPIIIENYVGVNGATKGIVLRDDYIYTSAENSFQIYQYTNSGCVYGIGDYNGNNAFNIADIISAFSKLKTGSPDASLLCECPYGSGEIWAVAMDLNNSCSFNIADVIAGFSKLKTGEPELVPCDVCPPGGR